MTTITRNYSQSRSCTSRTLARKQQLYKMKYEKAEISLELVKLLCQIRTYEFKIWNLTSLHPGHGRFMIDKQKPQIKQRRDAMKFPMIQFVIIRKKPPNEHFYWRASLENNSFMLIHNARMCTNSRDALKILKKNSIF